MMELNEEQAKYIAETLNETEQEPEHEYVRFRNPTKQLGFAQIPHIVTLDKNLSNGAFRMYALLHYFWQRRESTWVSVHSLSELLDVTTVTVSTYLKELSDRDLIVRQRRKGTSSVTFIEDLPRIYEEAANVILNERLIKKSLRGSQRNLNVTPQENFTRIITNEEEPNNNSTSSNPDDVLLVNTQTTPENTIIKEKPNGRDKVTGLHLPASITSSARDTNDSKPKKVKYPPRTEMAHYLAANCHYPWKGFNSHAERDAWEKMEGEFPRDRIKSKIDWAVTTPGMGPGVIADRIMTAVTKWNSPKGQTKSKLIDEVLFGDNNGDSKDSEKVSHSVSATGGSRTVGSA